ncbi:hypothetical protein PEC18_05075 [Paucibacter sp. O1-1]|uniref:hypothetical protein n=1 Tax=Aquabacterium sp. OR-4 TaxID=2978127 RepID=UPI0021B2C282|nr:hypothetical protein [Aquabacterium sp. OR-4]MCU7370257.1 hypothetical protein [Paucibacter sp. O1-1]MDA3825242.1 hypothetical protein [Paucibacter sp. O1-1]MDT7836482.1 hypothetical protein [Aquabacterium sp. OR-4]
MRALIEARAVLASRPEGYICKDLAAALQIKAGAASKRLGKMVTLQLCIVVGSCPRYARYFATQAQADSWAAANPALAHRPVRSRAQRTAERATARAAREAAPTIIHRVGQAVAAAGAVGTVSTQLRHALRLTSTQVYTALTTLQQDGLVLCQVYKMRRLCWPGKVVPSDAAVSALQRQVDAAVLANGRASACVRWGLNPEDPLRRTQPAPMSISPARLQGEADTSRAHITRAAPIPYTARHQYLQLPADPRWPSFSSIPLGATLSATHQQEAA